MTPRHVIIANPDSKRWLAYEPELRAFWHARGIEPDIELVPWSAIVARAGNLDDLPAFDSPAVVRLESPGRDWDVARGLIHLGAIAVGRTDAGAMLSLPYQKGKLVEPLLFYEGFRTTLARMAEAFASRPLLRVTCDPNEVAEMFDKNATCRRMLAAGLPIPRTRLDGGDDLWPTTYFKLNTGSSASAIVVMTGQTRGQSTLVHLRDGYYSSRRLATYSGRELDNVLGFLFEQGVCVQEGIRMATIDGRNFDVRVICIHGRPRFTIFRLSWLPMTNLHLGGQRGDPATCRAAIPMRAWLDAMDHCGEAARLYRSDAVGIDLLFEAGYQRHFLLEVNAFGDFFPGLTDEQGRSVVAVELEKMATHFPASG